MNFALDDAATLDGTVVQSGPGGAPVGQATVLLVDASGVNFSATTDATGAFAIGNLHPGSYAITVSAPGFATGQSTVVLTAGSTVTAPVSLAPGADVTVTVTNGSDAPVASALIQLEQNGTDVTTAETDSTGQATISGLAAGSYQLEVDASDLLSTTDSFTLSAGQTLSRS